MALSTSGKMTVLPCYCFSFRDQTMDSINNIYCRVSKLVYKKVIICVHKDNINP